MRCQNTNVVFLFLSNLQIYDFFAKKRNENLRRLFISSYESLKKVGKNYSWWNAAPFPKTQSQIV